MNLEAGIEPINTRLHKIDRIQWDRYQRLNSTDKRKKLVTDKMNVRLKTRKGWNCQMRKQNEEYDRYKKDGYKHIVKPWVNYTRNIQFEKVKLIKSKKEHTKEELKHITEELLKEVRVDYKIFTDGSTSEVQKNGGAGICILDKEERIKHEENWAAGKLCSSFGGECVAFINAIRWIKNNEEVGKTYAIITDSLSLVEWLKNMGKSNEEGWKAIICEEVRDLEKRVLLIWIPSHIEIRGNELADEQAKRGCNKNQDTLHVEREIINAKIKQEKFHIDHEMAKRKYGDKRSPKEEIEGKWSTRVRGEYAKMRTNHHSQLNYYRNKINHEESNLCRLCEEEIETSEHLVCYCTMLRGKRMQIFGEEIIKEEEMVKSPEKCKNLLEKVFSCLKD